jgi:hypothetical protein
LFGSASHEGFGKLPAIDVSNISSPHEEARS